MLIEENNIPPELDDLVRAEKLELLFHQSFPAIFVSIFNAALLCVILLPVQQRETLLIWFSILALSAGVRIAVFSRYREMAMAGSNILVWEKPYFVTLLISSLVWGVGGVAIMPLDSVAHQIAIFYFMIGMSGGAIFLYSAHRTMVLAATASLLMPTTGWFFIQGDLLSVGLAVGSVVFYLTAMRATKVLSVTLDQNFMLNHELKKSKESAERLARIDVLTGLYNRRAFYEQAEVMNSYAERHKKTLAIIIMDLDHFKVINDTHGHAAGDAALVHIGMLLQELTRKSDVCARIGGEEFGILLVSTNMLDASILAEKLRQEIEDSPVVFENKSLSITASFGVAGDELDFDTLFKCADAAMYQAKKAGRNQVVSDYLA